MQAGQNNMEDAILLLGLKQDSWLDWTQQTDEQAALG
jgi:hypothetical protein